MPNFENDFSDQKFLKLGFDLWFRGRIELLEFLFKGINIFFNGYCVLDYFGIICLQIIIAPSKDVLVFFKQFYKSMFLFFSAIGANIDVLGIFISSEIDNFMCQCGTMSFGVQWFSEFILHIKKKI